MARRLTAACLVLVLLSPIVPGSLAETEASSTTLVADAGSSQRTLGFRTSLPVDGQVFGGEAPYNVTWSIDGNTSRFQDPNATSTTVQLAGLTGTVNLTFQVTDDASRTASDHVLYHVAEPGLELVNRTIQVTAGVPDEIVGASGLADRQTTRVPFEVPAGTEALMAVLSWQDEPLGPVTINGDLDLVLVDPEGEEVNPRQGRSTNHPERVVVDGSAPGSWIARIEPWLSGPANATLTVVALDTVSLPQAVMEGPLVFGSEDEQRLEARAHGVGELSPEWDLDGDGLPEARGETTIADLPAGEHPIRFTVTDEGGFEDTTPMTVEAITHSEHALPVRCGGHPEWTFWAMEFSHSGGTCWMHSGHQTYVLDQPYLVTGARGAITSVEQQESPPTAFEDPPTHTPVRVEVSMDAQQWRQISNISYRFLEDPFDGAIGDEDRQRIHFAFDTDPTPARYFRLHHPRSAAQGLSGFLDQAKLYLFANSTGAPEATPPSLTEGTVELTCRDGDVLEDFYPSHPCFFGGVNRYDAPSFFHTYAPGEDTVVDRIEGQVQLAPWRTDDWFLIVPISPTPDWVNETAKQATRTQAFLQVSQDGQTWTTVESIDLLYGERAWFDVPLEQPTPARFVRLTTDHHPHFDAFRAQPALHHPEAMLVHSQLTLHGTVPAGR